MNFGGTPTFSAAASPSGVTSDTKERTKVITTLVLLLFVAEIVEMWYDLEKDGRC